VTWQVVFTRHAQKDAPKLAAAGLKTKAQELLNVLAENPFQNLIRNLLQQARPVSH
jgi:hypothetical protein